MIGSVAHPARVNITSTKIARRPVIRERAPRLAMRLRGVAIGCRSMWCAGRDLNPHGISTTSPSNSRVCHSTTRARHRLKKIHASNEVPILAPYFCARRARIILEFWLIGAVDQSCGAMRGTSRRYAYYLVGAGTAGPDAGAAPVAACAGILFAVPAGAAT